MERDEAFRLLHKVVKVLLIATGVGAVVAVVGVFAVLRLAFKG
jgi:hypothetical protein